MVKALTLAICALAAIGGGMALAGHPGWGLASVGFLLWLDLTLTGMGK